MRAVLVTVLTAILGYVVLAAAAVGFGFLLTRELLRGAIGDWDVDVTTWLVERRSPTRNDLSLWGSRFSETVTVAIVLLVVFALLALRRHWRELGIVAVAIAVEGATYATATYFVERHRPQVARLEDLIVADSYFSGHVAAAVAMYGSLAIVVWRLTRNVVLRVAFTALAVAAPVIVALSRMYRGMHYASDVTVGALVGLGCIAVALIAVRAGERAFRADDVTKPTVPEPTVAGGTR
ncbi:MAG: phosphatase PAP2 family protein [Acidimicrobiia bacterium]